MAAIFPDARDFRFRDINVFPAPALEALKELEPRIAAGAIYDSAERCDAPKCHPETRNAVQNDLYDWILDGDGSSGSPGKIMWVTGPAGSGKTAIMGSLADRCAANGFLGASFFFASWSTSGRRHKTFFVTTIAHQLAQHRDDLQTAISVAIQKNRGIFEKNIHVQMEVLVLSPLREVISRSDRSPLRGSIIIDGLDECEAEQYHDASIAGRHPGRRGRPERTNAEDQLEILQVLQVAASDPLFPFRILIASRPERVFRDFFDSEKNPSVLAKKLDLHEVYNADADIALFLEAEFSRLGRRYNLPPSWIPPGAVATLVYKASGQFIYAATVIRFLDTDHRQAPKALLEAILKMEAVATSNPLEELDELYLHILNSSPDPPLSALWICSISGCLPIHDSPASNVQALLQTDPASNEAEHLLGKLHSLIRIPPLRDQATTQYTFYHKSLLDFLNDPERSGNLYVEDREVKLFVWNAFVRACARASVAQYQESFLQLLAFIPIGVTLDTAIGHPQAIFHPASAEWWVSLAIERQVYESLWEMFKGVHIACPWYRCKPVCKIWSGFILRHLGSSTSTAPGLLWPRRRGRDWQDNARFKKLIVKAFTAPSR